MIREQGRLEGTKAEEMGVCGSRGDGRVWEQRRWQGMGAGEMGGVEATKMGSCGSRGEGGFGSRGDGRV